MIVCDGKRQGHHGFQESGSGLSNYIYTPILGQDGRWWCWCWYVSDPWQDRLKGDWGSWPRLCSHCKHNMVECCTCCYGVNLQHFSSHCEGPRRWTGTRWVLQICLALLDRSMNPPWFLSLACHKDSEAGMQVAQWWEQRNWRGGLRGPSAANGEASSSWSTNVHMIIALTTGDRL